VEKIPRSYLSLSVGFYFPFNLKPPIAGIPPIAGNEQEGK